MTKIYKEFFRKDIYNNFWLFSFPDEIKKYECKNVLYHFNDYVLLFSKILKFSEIFLLRYLYNKSIRFS